MDRSNGEVVVVDTGLANLASMLAGLRRAGTHPVASGDLQTIAEADILVLPGVGSFGAGMTRLRAMGAPSILADRVSEGRPLLAVCLGMQLLCQCSDESQGTTGVGALDAQVSRFSGDVSIPQLGWNRVAAQPQCQLLAEGYAYFANSYRLGTIPDGWLGATSDHGTTFVAGLERGPQLLCQFHPELSGPWGQSLLDRWLDVAWRWRRLPSHDRPSLTVESKDRRTSTRGGEPC